MDDGGWGARQPEEGLGFGARVCMMCVYDVYVCVYDAYVCV